MKYPYTICSQQRNKKLENYKQEARATARLGSQHKF